MSSEPVERFRPTSSRFVGFAGMTGVAALLVYVAVDMHTLAGLRLATGSLFAGGLVWVTQLRPRATAYRHTLHLRNSLRDATVPLRAIDDVSVRRMLDVRVGDERFVCIGVGKPLRHLVKARSRGPSALLGWDRLEAYTESATPAAPDQSAMRYQDFVEARISGLVEEARNRQSSPGDPRPQRTWAWPEIVGLAGTGAAFVLALLL